MTDIVLEAPAVAGGLESLTLDDLDLNDGIYWMAESMDVTPPPKRVLWLAAREGDALGDIPGYERRAITIRMRIRTEGLSMNAALEQIGLVSDKLQKAETVEGGIPLIWSPSGSTFHGTFYVLSGEITSLPVTNSTPDAGWFHQHRPVIEIRLDCKPFLYSDEIETTAVTNTDPMQVVTLGGVLGDVPAEGRVVVRDNASKHRDHVEWGLHTGTTAQTITNLIFDTTLLTVSGYSGTETTFGSVDVIDGTPSPSWIALCSTGDRQHVGTYRVKARVYTSVDVEGAQVRLAWRAGDAPHTRNPAVEVPVGVAWTEVDLGTIYIPEAVLGDQRWEGRVEIAATSSAGTLHLNHLLLVPAERYGLARAPVASVDATPTEFSVADEFDQAPGALDGKTARLGGTWSGHGDAVDLAVVAAIPFIDSKRVERSEPSDANYPLGRYAVIGSDVAGCGVKVDFKFSAVSAGTNMAGGVIARYVDTTNMVGAWLAPNSTGGIVAVRKMVAGAETYLFVQYPASPYLNAVSRWYTLQFAADASGIWGCWIALAGNPLQQIASGQDDDLATGGPLASGKVGISDAYTAAGSITRNYDNFASWAPEEDHAIFSDEAIEFRSDDTLRANSDGSIYGRPPVSRGARALIPHAGDGDRVTRVVAKARRNDVVELVNSPVDDSTTVQVFYKARWLTVPRS